MDLIENSKSVWFFWSSYNTVFLEQVRHRMRDRLVSLNLFLTLSTSPSYYLKNKCRCTPMCLKGAATLVPRCFVCMVCDHPMLGFSSHYIQCIWGSLGNWESFIHHKAWTVTVQATGPWFMPSIDCINQTAWDWISVRDQGEAIRLWKIRCGFRNQHFLPLK